MDLMKLELKHGVVIHQNTANISIIGRNTQGVKLIRLDKNDRISDVALAAVSSSDENNSEDEEN